MERERRRDIRGITREDEFPSIDTLKDETVAVCYVWYSNVVKR